MNRGGGLRRCDSPPLNNKSKGENTMKVFTVSFILASAFALSACATNPETGESEFSIGGAVSSVVEKFQSVPDDVKAGSLDAIAWILGATGVGGVGAVLAQKGANYYRNRAAQKRGSTADADATATELASGADIEGTDAGKV